VCLVQPREDVWLLFDAAATDDRATHAIAHTTAHPYANGAAHVGSDRTSNDRTDCSTNHEPDAIAYTITFGGTDSTTAICVFITNWCTYSTPTDTRTNHQANGHPDTYSYYDPDILSVAYPHSDSTYRVADDEPDASTDPCSDVTVLFVRCLSSDLKAGGQEVLL